MKKSICLLVIAVLVNGCAANSGVVKIGEGTYKIYRRAATGFASGTAIREQITLEANEFCVGQGKVSKVLEIGGSHPPYILGNFPKAEIQFVCLDANDPQLKPEKLAAIQQPSQDAKIDGDNSGELTIKLKNLNKMLADGLITQNDFDGQKKKLLDNYTS